MLRLIAKHPVQTLCLLVPASALALTLNDAAERDAVNDRERAYRQEQARIDLELTNIRLEAARGKISYEEAQSKTDAWMEASSARLKAQAELAAELDSLLPLPPEPQAPAGPDPVMADAPEAARYAELESAEREAVHRFQAEAADQVELQALIDAWANGEEGAALLEEKQRLWRQAADRKSFTIPQTEPPPEEAGAAEKALWEIEARGAARLRELVEVYPEATPEEMQEMVDALKKDFDADAVEAVPWRQRLERERLEAEAVRLRAEAESLPAPSSDGNSESD